MKTFEILCIIYDKFNPLLSDEEISEIRLCTTLLSESEELAIEQIKLLYDIKTIINIQEII